MRPARLVACAVLAAVPCAASELPPTSARAIRARAAFLASDALEGRDTGSRGYQVAARYAASEFEAWGLEPGGEGGSYFQPVPFVSSSIDSIEMAAVRGSVRTPLVLREDFVAEARATHDDVDVEAGVVFVGFGIDAPDLGHRDYEGVDVAGRVVLMLSGAPAEFPTDERAHHSSRRLKAELAAARGAVGTLMVRTRQDAERTPWERVKQYVGRETLAWVGPDGEVQDAFPELRFTALLGPDGAARLLDGSGTGLGTLLDEGDSGATRSRELPVSVSVHARYAHERVESPNVVGVLRGSDAALAGEYVVCTAHLDHVGRGREVDGDDLYNGFYDNAMGSAIVLEMARSLSGADPRPRRSIAFVLVTGEEKGLLGSDYFAHHPTLPRDAIVANVNVDMPLLLHPVADLIAYGAEHSSLGELARAAAARHGFRLSPDPEPEEVIFVRSDQYSFVREGIPAINVDAGPASTDPAVDGVALVTEFRKKHYHRPSDESSLPVDFDALDRYTRVNLEVLVGAADADARPSWNAGDFFGDLFGGGSARTAAP